MGDLFKMTNPKQREIIADQTSYLTLHGANWKKQP